MFCLYTNLLLVQFIAHFTLVLFSLFIQQNESPQIFRSPAVIDDLKHSVCYPLVLPLFFGFTLINKLLKIKENISYYLAIDWPAFPITFQATIFSSAEYLYSNYSNNESFEQFSCVYVSSRHWHCYDLRRWAGVEPTKQTVTARCSRGGGNSHLKAGCRCYQHTLSNLALVLVLQVRLTLKTLSWS